MFRTVIFKIILGLYFIAWTPLLGISLLSKRTTLIALRLETMGVLYLARIVAGIKYQIHYPMISDDDIPNKPDTNHRLDGKAIIAAKHMSIMEVAILFLNVPKPFFILKRELMWIPIYGWAFARVGFQPVNRTRGKTNMRRLADNVAKKIMNRYTLIIFPEGTRVKPGNHAEIRRGLLFLAHELKLPILPVGTDSGLYWPKRGRMHPGTTNVYFEELLPASADAPEITAAINRHSA